jgi:addiction module HigA family antidote
MPMLDPPHPGRVVRQECLEPLGLTVTAGAKALGVTRQALNNVVNGKAGISAEMAIRLATAFGGGAEAWLRMQANHDLAQVRKREAEIVSTVRCVEWPEVRT